MVYFPISQSNGAQLGIDDFSNLYVKENQYYYSDDQVTYLPTCVGASDSSASSCKYNNLVCAGTLRTQYGTLEQQRRLLAQALAESDKKHVNCPPATCNPYNGYSPEDFELIVTYCK